MYSPLRALFMLRTAQNLPHMEQVSSCSGERLARTALAVSGSRAQAHWASQSRARRGVAHPVVDLPGAPHPFGNVGGVGGDAAGG